MSQTQNGIIKGEAFSIAFTINSGNTIITPASVDGVRIKLGSSVAVYPNGTLDFNNADQTWRFPLTQALSYAIPGAKADYQVQIKIGENVYSSQQQSVTVGETMFRKEW